MLHLKTHLKLILLFLLMLALSDQTALAGPFKPPVCPRHELWQARKALLEMVSFESLRYVRIKLGLYKKWTGPASPKLISECKELKRVLDETGEGAVLFTELDSDLYRNIASYSASWVSHTGVAMLENDEWVVFESRAPNGLKHPTMLCDFLRRSANYHVAVARPRVQLTSQQLELLRTTMRNSLHVKYDLTFNLDNPQGEYCSKFVYEAYRKIGVSFGQVETLQDLYDGYKASPSGKMKMNCFFQAWFEGMSLFETSYEVPWGERTITPASQYFSAVNGIEDPNRPFELIYESQ